MSQGGKEEDGCDPRPSVSARAVMVLPISLATALPNVPSNCNGSPSQTSARNAAVLWGTEGEFRVSSSGGWGGASN